MGFFSLILGKAIKIQHPFFGEMHFNENKKNPRKSYFNCRRHFRPSDKTIEIVIDANIDGPTEKQTAFFIQIEDNYIAIAKAIAPLIEDAFRNWKGGFKIENFGAEFEPVDVRIPSCEANPITWEISLETEHDRNHTFILTMQDFEAREILIDG